jgi:hypothetical protein
MVLVLTLHQPSAVNCAARKRSAMTSIAAADDVSTFLFSFSFF